MNKPLLLATLAAGLIVAATTASAQSANFNAWTAAGDVLVGSATSATLTTAAVESGETPITANSALQFFELEPALALVGGTLAADTYEGSGLQQSFIAAAGATISFNWSLSTVGYTAALPDRAFVVLDGSTVLPLGTVAASTVTGTFTRTFASGGSHSLAIVVMDVNDYIGLSTLQVSALQVSAVPEPASIAMLLAGLGLVGGAARARRNATAQGAM